MRAWWLWCLLLVGCVSPTADLEGIAGLPPLDRAVIVSGGAFLVPAADGSGAFRPPDRPSASGGAAANAAPAGGVEAIPLDDIIGVLERGKVFQRLVVDPDPERRARMAGMLRRRDEPELASFLQDAQQRGFDLLLVIEELEDGPIENQGTNNRWPVTFATWILLGVGALIPDRTFESRAEWSVSLRDLQTGRELHNMLLAPGRVELALIERTDIVGLLQSIIVPPFWVRDDAESVRDSVRATAQQRLLLSLARDLKGPAVRRRISETVAARIELVAGRGRPRVVVESRESVAVAVLDGAGYGEAAADAVRRFERELLASERLQGLVFHYEAELPPATAAGLFQVKVGTLRGGVASATFTEDSAR